MLHNQKKYNEVVSHKLQKLFKRGDSVKEDTLVDDLSETSLTHIMDDAVGIRSANSVNSDPDGIYGASQNDAPGDGDVPKKHTEPTAASTVDYERVGDATAAGKKTTEDAKLVELASPKLAQTLDERKKEK